MAEANHDGEAAESSTGSNRATKVLLVLIALIFVWYLVSDRLTPYTASARLSGYVVPVVPDVSGYIADIPVKKYQLAEAGDTLVQIEQRRFELAVRAAEAALEVAGQDVGAGTAGVANATARLVRAD